MKLTDGEDDKRTRQDNDLVGFSRLPKYVEHAAIKVALGNLFLQREIEQQVNLARDEHAKIVTMLSELQAKADKIETQPPERCSPPAMAAFLLAFIAPKNTVQPFLGDLEEVFHKNAARFGERQARRQYWMQVFASLGPLAWQWVKRMGFITVLVDYFRVKSGL